MLYNVFLHSHIISCSYMRQCLLTPSPGSFNPTVVPSQHIKYLCTLISCLFKFVVFFFHKSTIINIQLMSAHKHVMC